MATRQREFFSSRWVFILAAVGSAAGLGNVWRFPYMAYTHGGSSFFIAYIICLLVIGLPFLLLENGLGQISEEAAPGALASLSPTRRYQWIGWGAVLIAFCILTFYVVIMAWIANYLYLSHTLPWGTQQGEYFFYHQFLHITSDIHQKGILNLPIVLGAAIIYILLYGVLSRGTQGIAKVALFITPLPFALLFLLALNALSLEGALSGVYYFLAPRWSSLFSAPVWIAAAGQVFFTLSLGTGVMFAYGSLLDKKVNIPQSILLIIAGDTMCSLLGGIAIFGILGHMAYLEHLPLTQVIKGGVGLAFIAYPQALAQLPYAPHLFSMLFFFSLLTLAFTSAVSIGESIVAALCAVFKNRSRRHIVHTTLFLSFLIGLAYSFGNGLYILDKVDHIISHYALLIIGLLEALAIGWVYKAKRLREELAYGSGTTVSPLFDLFIRWIIPLILLILLVIEIKQAI